MMACKNTIISWNCNGLFLHLEDLKLLTAEYNPIAICLQETHLKQNHAQGGVLIAIRSDLHHEEIKLHTNLQILAAKVYAKNPYTLCTAYFPPIENISEEYLRFVIRSLPAPFIFAGDFHSRNPLCGSSRRNYNGEILENILLDEQLIILNTNTKTHFNFSHRSWSNLDLVFCSPQLSSSLYVHTHIDLAGSDHTPILIHRIFTSLNMAISQNVSTIIKQAGFSITHFAALNSVQISIASIQPTQW